MIATCTAARVTGVAVIDLGCSDEAALYGYSSAAAVIPVLRSLGLEVFYLRAARLLSFRGRFQMAFPTRLGAFGEDSKLQGLLQILDIPYVGSGVAASAIGTHKGLTKRLLRDLGLPVADGVAVPFPALPAGPPRSAVAAGYPPGHQAARLGARLLRLHGRAGREELCPRSNPSDQRAPPPPAGAISAPAGNGSEAVDGRGGAIGHLAH
jgi:hypothetical protein